MMIRRILFTTIIALIAATPNAYAFRDYQYDEDESPLVFRARIGAKINQSEEDTIVNGVNFGDIGSDNIIDTNVAFEGELSYHMTDHFAFTTSLGYQPTDKSVIGIEGQSTTTEGKIIIMPITAMLQYHIAPYGQIRPYVGVGAHYSRIVSTYNLIEESDRFKPGLVLQAGGDWWLNKQWAVNFDIKQYFLEVEFDQSDLDENLNDRVVRAKINPLILSAGLAYRF